MKDVLDPSTDRAS